MSLTGGEGIPQARILVADDELILRDSIAEGLRLEGWDVQVTSSGIEALARLASERFDLVVLDWMLPDLDGIEVLRRVRRHAPLLPILMVTARNTAANQAVAQQGG